MPHSTNSILEALPRAERDALHPFLSHIELTQRTVLYDVNTTIETVYFPTDAAVSFVVPLSKGAAVEAAMVGHDGVVGGSAVLNGGLSLNRAVVQLQGG